MSFSSLAMTAKKVIEDAWRHGPPYDLATQAAEALEAAQLLQSPETAAAEPIEADRLTRTFAPTQALSNDDQAEAPPLVVYRAYSGSIPLGTYTNPTAARAHCEDKARLERPTGSFAWVSDPNGGGDLVEGEMELLTGYVVTSLEVASEYDPEADG